MNQELEQLKEELTNVLLKIAETHQFSDSEKFVEFIRLKQEFETKLNKLCQY